MAGLLIHDLSEAEWERCAEEYKDWTVISDNGNIRPCIGCFHCWTSGTGTCVFKDGYENMGKLIHEADELVIMSRYTYGGFSSFVKNAFDRCIGYVLPEFETAYGEMHHKKRYAEDKPVTFRFRGSGLGEEEKEKARQYVSALCRNLRGTVKEVIFDACAPEEEKTVSISRERSGILLVSCSLRETSNTKVFLDRLIRYLDVPADIVSLASSSPEEITEAFAGAKTAVIGIPLYVDGLPASAVRLMEAVQRSGAGKDCRVYALVNNGLYESRQNVNILNMIREWCAKSGCLYQGALAVGAGEVMGVLMRSTKHVLWPARNAVNGIKALAKSILGDSKTEDIYADPYLFPRWLYILIANTNWQFLKKKARSR